MDDSNEVKQLLTDIRDLLRRADERQKKLAQLASSLQIVVYVTLALCVLLAGFLLWLILGAASAPQ